MSVNTERIEIETAGGAMPAFLAEPEGAGPFPSVVVIMEAFGLVPSIEGVAERLAAEGYVAIAPDFYYRDLPNNKFDYDSIEAAVACMANLTDDMFVGDMSAVIDAVNARPNTSGKVGVTGFCMGGRLSFLTACELADRIDCAAPFYGAGIVGLHDRAEKIRCPLHLFFGEKDSYIPNDQVDATRDTLERLGKDFSLELYPGADHGFFCDERESYNEAAATDAWPKLKALFAANLKGRG